MGLKDYKNAGGCSHIFLGHSVVNLPPSPKTMVLLQFLHFLAKYFLQWQTANIIEY